MRRSLRDLWRNSARREACLALGVLAALLAVAYGNVVFGGRSLVYSNSLNPLDYRHLPQSYGPDPEPLATWDDRNLLPNANFHDSGGPVWQWEPDAVFAREGLLAGEAPLWNPYVAAGTPEMANQIPTLAFPPYLALIALGNTVALRNAYQLLVVLAAGFFTYLFLRRHDLSILSSLTGASAFMFCGAITQNVGSFHGQTTACMPVALYLTRRFLDRPTARWAAGLALGFAAISLSSFPPVLAACFGFAVLYAAVAVLTASAGPGAPARGRALLGFAAAAGLALGLAAFYYLPAFALERAAPQVDRAYEGAAKIAIQPITLVELASPLLRGAGEILRDTPAETPDVLRLPYAGWLPLLLCPLALRPPRGRARALWAAGWLALALLLVKLLGLPPVQWLAALPLVNHLHVAHYFGDLVDFVVALLAALGLEQLRRGAARAPLTLAGAAGGLLFLFLLLRHRLAVGGGALDPRWATQWENEWWLLVEIAVVATGLFRLGARRAAEGRTTRGVAVALLALVGVEAVYHTYYPRPKAFDVWRHPPDYVRALKSAAGDRRVLSAAAFPANAGGAFGIRQLGSLMAFNPPRIFALYRRYVSPLTFTFLGHAAEIPPEGVLDRAGIELLVVGLDAPALLAEVERRPYERVYADGFARIFRRHGSPHFYFSSEFRVLGPEEALAELGRLPAGRLVLLESAPSFAPFPNRGDDPAVTVVALRRNRYHLRVEAPRPGLVYCADSLFPGWSARVNGRPARILPANYAFRAVEVPAGRSEVELAYWPPGLTAGLALSALSLAIAGALALRPPPLRAPAGPASMAAPPPR
jgi:membrane protein YfhO